MQDKIALIVRFVQNLTVILDWSQEAQRTKALQDIHRREECGGVGPGMERQPGISLSSTQE